MSSLAPRDMRETDEAVIYGTGYRGWDAEFKGSVYRVLSMAWNEARFQMHNKWVLLLLLFRLLNWVFDALEIGYLGTFTMLYGPWGFRYYPETFQSGNDYGMAEEMFYMLGTQSSLSDMLLVIVVGATSISNDRNWGVTSLYFSRPLHRYEYILGKFLSLSIFMTVFTWIPTLWKFALIGVVNDYSGSEWLDSLWVLGVCLLFGAIVMIVVGSMVLSLSSVSKRGFYVGVPLVLLSPLGMVLPGIMVMLEFDHYYLFGGIQENLRILLGAMLGCDIGLFYTTSWEGPSADVSWVLSLMVVLSVVALSLLNLFYQVARMEVDE